MEDGRQLILQAFEQARASNKADWYRMTPAVLKNRILNVTRGTFTESHYGATSFSDFVSGFSDVVTAFGSGVHTIVELNETERGRLTQGGSERRSQRARVRSDLWRAALDYASGSRYVWDASERQARPEVPGDEYSVIKTLSVDEQQEWREAFFHEQSGLGDLSTSDQEHFKNWLENGLPTTELPVSLVPRWNRYLRDSVHTHLVKWFEEAGLSPPPDLLTTPVEPPARSVETEALRRLVIRVIEQMTDRELSDLVLPPRAVLRATTPRRG